jgi:hypothetical protein
MSSRLRGGAAGGGDRVARTGTSTRRALGFLMCVLASSAGRAHAHTCDTSSASDCTKNHDRTCTVTCDETDLRNAVDVVNQCGGHRTLTFSFPACSGGCTIAMLNQSPTASCGEKSNAICLTGDSMTIDGANGSAPGVTFKYTGPYKCTSCSGSCSGPQPALFVVKGSNDTVRNLVMNFFPEDIQVEGPSGDTVAGLHSSYYCEEALTINGGTGHTIHDSVLTGATDPEAGNAGGLCYKERAVGTGPASKIACTTDTDCHGSCSTSGANCSSASDCATGETCDQVPSQQCHCANGYFASESINGGSCATASSGTCYRKALCGLDKAIQINGGTGLSITKSTFSDALTPVLVSDGLGPASATVDSNQVTGSQVGLTLSTEPTFTIPAEEVCHSLAASGPTATGTFTKNTVAFCKFGIQARQGANVHASQNTVHDDYVSGFEVEDASRLTGSLNRLRNNGTAPTTPGDLARGGVVVANVAASVDFGSRLASGEPGLNVFCGALPSIYDVVASIPAACPGAPVTAERNCFEAGEHLADTYGKVDDSDHGAVGIDPLCTDYQLTCTF